MELQYNSGFGTFNKDDYSGSVAPLKMTNRRPKALVVDHEIHARRTLRTILMNEGCYVIEAPTGEDALEEIKTYKPDLVLLDVNLPGIDGFRMCASIRALSEVPILVVSASESENDVVRALDAGADDYLVKPFRSKELLARIRAVIRRVPGTEEMEPFEGPDLTVDFEHRQVIANKQPVHLTPTEFELLKILVVNKGKPVSYLKLLNHIWGPRHRYDRDALRVFVGQLRKKIEPDLDEPRYILTEPLIGYRFDPQLGKLAKGSK